MRFQKDYTGATVVVNLFTGLVSLKDHFGYQQINSGIERKDRHQTCETVAPLLPCISSGVRVKLSIPIADL